MEIFLNETGTNTQVLLHVYRSMLPAVVDAIGLRGYLWGGIGYAVRRSDRQETDLVMI